MVEGAGISGRRGTSKLGEGLRNQLTRDKEWDVRNLILIDRNREICYDRTRARAHVFMGENKILNKKKRVQS